MEIILKPIKKEFGLEVCGPRKIDLPLKDEKVIKIKSTIDRNAVITGKFLLIIRI